MRAVPISMLTFFANESCRICLALKHVSACVCVCAFISGNISRRAATESWSRRKKSLEQQSNQFLMCHRHSHQNIEEIKSVRILNARNLCVHRSGYFILCADAHILANAILISAHFSAFWAIEFGRPYFETGNNTHLLIVPFSHPFRLLLADAWEQQ